MLAQGSADLQWRVSRSLLRVATAVLRAAQAPYVRHRSDLFASDYAPQERNLDQLVEAEEDQRSRSEVPEHAYRDHGLRGQDYHHQGDGGSMPLHLSPPSVRERVRPGTLTGAFHRTRSRLRF